jgi:hypothetical protein
VKPSGLFHHHRRAACALGALAVLSGLAAVRAAGPTFWTIATAADLLKGTSDGVFVSLDGVVTLGPRLTSRLTSAPAQVWSLTASSDGTLWAGTGGDGRVIRVRPGQAEETVFDADEASVFAIAVAGTRVYAATSPDGRVYVIEGTNPARPFFDPVEKYIWALAADAAGSLWIGAGSPAVMYRVDSGGTGQVIYRPPAAHVVCLARDAAGRLLAGTESPGRLYRFEASNRPFVLLDSGLTELRSVALGPNGVLFAAAVARGEDAAPSGGEAASIAVAVVPAAGTTGAPASTPANRRSVVYRIEPTGTWEPLWETPDVIYDVAAAAGGGVLAASGPDGRLYRVTESREVLLLTGVDAKQITHFAPSATPEANPPAFATANPGRVVAMASDVFQSPATYMSPVRDTRSVATWGVIRWESSGGVVLHTRSGNTEKPDDSWSDWTAAYARREGEVVRSPAARFMQWKAVLTDRAASLQPRLTSVTVAYLARNGRPLLSSVTAHPPGVVFQRPFATEDGAIAGLDDVTADARRPPGDTGPPPPAPGRRMYQKSLQTLAWKAEDPDGDRMTYLLQFRREGEATWRDLRAGLSDTIFVWDTTTVADGRYVIRVVASDGPSNAPDRALSGERASDPIEIDNTPPAVTTEVTRQAGATQVIVTARDGQSPIQKAEYSLGGGPWQVIYPVDGIADSPEERYEIALATEADASRVVVRITDALQNVTSRAVTR